MERCTRVLISDPEERKGKWRELMPEAKEVFLELGCGKGRFTAETAAQNPQALYIAVERVPDAMVIAMGGSAPRNCTTSFLWMGTWRSFRCSLLRVR